MSLARFRASAPPQQWLVDGLISDDALTVLGVGSGGGNTFAAMAIAVARGMPLLGRAVAGRAGTPRPARGVRGDWSRRIDQLARGMGTTCDELEDRLDVYPSRSASTIPASLAR